MCLQEYAELKSEFERLKRWRDSKAEELRKVDRKQEPLRRQKEEVGNQKARLDTEVKQKVRLDHCEHADCDVDSKHSAYLLLFSFITLGSFSGRSP